MKTRRTTLPAIAIATVMAVTPHAALTAASPGKPNILFLFSDDQSYETVRAFGHTDIDTPNLDRLAARGTTFTHAYNMGAWHGAVCVASRTMLVTGRTVWRAKVAEKNLKADLQANRLWPQRMAAQGYETYFTGKWHIQADAAKAFGHTVNKRPGMPKDEPEGYNRPISGKPDPWCPSDPKFGGFWQGGKHWSDMYDHSLRVPFIVNGPGVKAGAKIDAPIHLQDAMATALDLAGADREGVEFQSVRPLLTGEGKGLDAVYAAYMDSQRAVIHDGWKLILYPKAKVTKLYHLAADPQEMKDLAADPAMAARKKTLFAKLRKLQQDYDDKLDLTVVFPEFEIEP